MTNPDTGNTQLEILLSLDRIINEAERARILRDQLLADARQKDIQRTRMTKSLTGRGDSVRE